MAEEEDDSETGFSSSIAGELAWGFIDVEDRRGRWDHGEQWRRAELHVMNEAKLGNDLPAADSVRADAIPGGPWQTIAATLHSSVLAYPEEASRMDLHIVIRADYSLVDRPET
jgi:hypothetical protein